MDLLSSRGRIGWGGPVATQRPPMNPTYEFGGGFPDPVSFPYEGMIEATARMMADEGAAAMTYGDPQGYRGLRELVCEKYERFESLLDLARQHHRGQRLRVTRCRWPSAPSSIRAT